MNGLFNLICQYTDQQYEVAAWGSGLRPYLDVPVPGDHDGDGLADIAVWRASEHTWYVRCSVDGSVIKQAQGIASDVIVSARPR